MATPRLPSRDPDHRPTTAKRTGPIELHDVQRKPPAAPRTFRGKRERELWRELYAEPVAELWRPTDTSLVVRLIGLRVRLEREGADASGWVYAATSSLEDRLLLNPRARRAAGIVYVPPPVGDSRGGKVRQLDDRRRERMARG